MNKKQYASSVYSQKSTASAKSGRSFLSFSTSLWKAARNTDDNDKQQQQQQQQQKWYNFKSWIPLKATGDNDSTKSITTNSTNSSSISKIKRLLFISSTSPSSTPTDSPKPPSSLDTTDSSSPNNEQTFYRPPQKNGILINRDGESTDQHRRRKHKRRENIIKLQQHHQHHFHFRRLDSKNHQNNFVLEPPPIPPTTTTMTNEESSSSDTLLGDPDQYLKQKSVSFNNDDQDEQVFNPRIIFVEPSPVPRFRNVAPPPPPSPPYMSILIEDDMDHKSNSRNSFQSIINTLDEDDEDDDSAPPTIYTSKNNIKLEPEEEEEEHELAFCENEHERRMTLLLQTLYNEANKKPPRLYFKSPFHRGQTIQFQLQNTIPEDNIILFKFLTSNNNSMEERYFIRPSAGKILSSCQLIMLFLNQIPPRDEKKDKILVKYAVIQRNTRVEDWLMKLNDNTRRKWIDMVEEEWPELVKSTRIRIRFV